MAWNDNNRSLPLKALSSMAGMQFRIVELATSEINACDYAAGGGGFGVLRNEPLANEFATVVVEGEIQCRAGAAVSIRDYITVAASGAGGSGWAVKANSGDALPRTIMGQALSAAASGSLFTLFIQRQRVFVTSAAVLNGAN